jgi:hypothetical protein
MKLTGRALAMLAVMAGVWAANSATDSSAIEAGNTSADTSRTVLIIKSNSYLEGAVAKIVQDSLRLRGLQVEFASLAHAGRIGSRQYHATIIFNAINRDESVNPVVERISRIQNRGSSNILVFSVSGDRWNGTSTEKTDALTAATKTLKPGDVAARIMHIYHSLESGK